MKNNAVILLSLTLAAAPLAYAHDGADGVPGTPDTTCETGAEWADHDYGPPAAGLFIQGHQESNLEDCDGDFDPTNPICWAEEAARVDLDGDTNVCERFDDDGHSEYTRGGAWLLVNSGDGVTGGTVLCFGRAGHHPNFGPVTVEDLVLGQTVPFSVEADIVDATGLADPCGDFQSDVSTSCVGTCVVTYPAGLDGSYQVYVGGFLSAPVADGEEDDDMVEGLLAELFVSGAGNKVGASQGSQGHVRSGGGGCSYCQANCLMGTCSTCCAGNPNCFCDLSGTPRCGCA